MKKSIAIHLMVLTGFTVSGTHSAASTHNGPSADFMNRTEIHQVVQRLESFMGGVEKDMAFIAPDFGAETDSFEMELESSALRLEAQMLVIEEMIRYQAAEADPESDRANHETESILDRLNEQHAEIYLSLRYMAPGLESERDSVY